MRTLLAAVLSLAASIAARAEAPPIEAFAALPDVEDVALSPDGRRLIALINLEDGRRIVRAFDYADGAVTGTDAAIDASELKPRGVEWATNDYALIWVSEKKDIRYFRESDIEFGAVFGWNMSDPPKQLLARSHELGLNSSLSNVIATVPGENAVLMSAFAAARDVDRVAGREYSVFKVDLDGGRGRVIERGDRDRTRAFLADEDGVRAQIDHVEGGDQWIIYAFHDGHPRRIFEVDDSPQIPFGVLGLTPDGASLVLSTYGEDGAAEIRHMSLEDGTMSDPVFSHAGADILGPVANRRTDRVLGYAVSNLEGPQYVFYDAEDQAVMDAVTARLPGSRVVPVSWSDDGQIWLFHAEGGSAAGAYLLYDQGRELLLSVASQRPDIPTDRIATVAMIEYAARDGRKIPSLLTLPIGVEPANLPTIVMPHGGPEAHDSYRWDWKAQYFANQGYAVLQPNFRGSDGFGPEFTRAGYGEWGGAMQNDISDGVDAMIRGGYADPDRVCIVGWSYGGYAALAGAVFTPELYRCVIAGGAISDLPRMIRDESRAYGGRSWVVDYWREVMSGPDGETRLRDVSPVRFAENVRAPVLLIHGRDDTVVEIEQSRAMRNALQRADKDVELIELRGEDHWLSVPETRVEALRAMDAFLKEHLGPGAGAD